MAKGTIYRVFLAVEAEQISGPDLEWDLVVATLRAKLNRKLQIGNLNPAVLRVRAEVDTAEESDTDA